MRRHVIVAREPSFAIQRGAERSGYHHGVLSLSLMTPQITRR
jgi:hypothetical protein